MNCCKLSNNESNSVKIEDNYPNDNFKDWIEVISNLYNVNDNKNIVSDFK